MTIVAAAVDCYCLFPIEAGIILSSSRSVLPALSVAGQSCGEFGSI